MDTVWIIALNIIAILISPLIASGVTLYFTHKNDKKKEKLEILKKLMTTRLNRSTLDYVYALNIIDIVFYNCANVRNEYKKLLQEYHSDKPSIDEINTRNLKLIEAIVNNLGYNKIDWEDISKPYAPKWYYAELEKQETYKSGQLAMANLLKVMTSKSNEN